MIVKYIEFLDDLWIWYYDKKMNLMVHNCNSGITNFSAHPNISSVRNSGYETIIHDDGEE